MKVELIFIIICITERPFHSDIGTRIASRDMALGIWKEQHLQHCLAFHLDTKGCTRGRNCAFLHVDVLNRNSFNEQDWQGRRKRNEVWILDWTVMPSAVSTK